MSKMHMLGKLGCLLALAVIGCASDQKPDSATPGGAGGGSSGTSAGGSSGSTSTSSGGSGGAQQPPMHVVSACPTGTTTGSGAAGAAGTAGAAGLVGPGAGTWENITPSVLTDGVQAVAMDPHDYATLYLGSNKKGLYKSADCGANWVKINTGRNASVIDTGMLWDIVIDPIDPKVMYLINGYGSLIGLWKTTNGGVDWDQLFPADSEVAKTVQYDFASIVSMDPTDHLHLVVTFHADCSGAYAPGCQAETKDGGATWRLFKSPATASWEGAWPTVLGAKTWLYGLPFDGLWRTADNGATWANITPTGGTGASGQLYRTADGAYFLASLQGVLTSTDNTSWSLVANSGNLLVGLTGDGTTMFASQQTGGKYFTAKEADPMTWTELPTTGMPAGHMRGGFNLVVDRDHHLLFSANQPEGLWRLAIPQ